MKRLFFNIIDFEVWIFVREKNSKKRQAIYKLGAMFTIYEKVEIYRNLQKRSSVLKNLHAADSNIIIYSE